MKAEEIYNLFKEGISDLKGRFDSLEGRFESLETKIDDKFVNKELLEEKLKPYEEMRNRINNLVWGLIASLIISIAGIIFTLVESGLLIHYKP